MEKHTTNIEETAARFWNVVLVNKHSTLPDNLREEIQQLGPENLIVYLYNQYNGASVMTGCFLFLFEYWKDFSFSKWHEIFRKITDENSGQYYLTHLFCCYLGINPCFEKYNNLIPTVISFPENQVISGGTIFGSEGSLRKHYEAQLLNYQLTISQLQTISNRLICEGAVSIKGNDIIEFL